MTGLSLVMQFCLYTMDFQAGQILYFSKPLKWTSFDLVNKIRIKFKYELGIKKIKVGHAGTLDPLATGLMIVCTGKATKQIESLQAGVKEYVADIKLGATTPSFDLETEIDATFPTAHITLDLIQQVLPQFIGEIEQIPPAYSALKVDGKRAYELARKGKDVKMKPKMLVIDELEILSFKEDILQLRVVCSKGTYIRALARDIGEALQSGGHLVGLERTRIGDINLSEAMTLEEFEKKLIFLKQNQDSNV